MNAKDIKEILKYSGAFIATIIGPGYATGQEIMQFFSGYGIKSFPAFLLNLLGFWIFAVIMLMTGYNHKSTEDFDSFHYYCGKKIGTIYKQLVIVTMMLSLPEQVSAEGAILNEYFGINHYFGVAACVSLFFLVYIIGFDKMVSLISGIIPAFIVFSIFISISALFVKAGQLGAAANSSVLLNAGQLEAAANVESGQMAGLHIWDIINRAETVLGDRTPGTHWTISTFLYVSMNYELSGIFFTELGRNISTKKNVHVTAFVSAVVLTICIAVLSIALQLNAAEVSKVEIPTLYLAMQISPIIGTIFMVTIAAGIFCSGTTLMWSICSSYFAHDAAKNKILAIVVCILIFLIGLIPLGNLVHIIQPLIGYVGLLYMFCVLVSPLKNVFDLSRAL